jgi:peptidoglycan/xylan/chitin deacetylase (PgdA/CDA1 family)
VPGAVILLYHSIADLHQDPYDLCVRPSHFEGHLKVLSKLGHAVPLPEFARTIRMRKSFRRTFIMTFDDGYADNLINAKPLLDQCCLPATVFVTADHFGTVEQFWWNELAILILQTAEAPELLCVEAGGQRKTWRMTKAPPVDFGPKWTLKHPDSASRHTIFRRMHAWLSGLADEDRKSAMYQIRNWAATGRQKTGHLARMSPAQIKELGQDGLVEIGAHTSTHPRLADLPAERQREEIEGSKSALENALGREVLSFAYPHGSSSAVTRRLVEQAGYTCACSTASDFVYRGSDLYQLPRLRVRDWDMKSFESRLRWWLAAAGMG